MLGHPQGHSHHVDPSRLFLRKHFAINGPLDAFLAKMRGTEPVCFAECQSQVVPLGQGKALPTSWWLSYRSPPGKMGIYRLKIVTDDESVSGVVQYRLFEDVDVLPELSRFMGIELTSMGNLFMTDSDFVSVKRFRIDAGVWVDLAMSMAPKVHDFKLYACATADSEGLKNKALAELVKKEIFVAVPSRATAFKCYQGRSVTFVTPHTMPNPYAEFFPFPEKDDQDPDEYGVGLKSSSA